MVNQQAFILEHGILLTEEQRCISFSQWFANARKDVPVSKASRHICGRHQKRTDEATIRKCAFQHAQTHM